MTTIKNFFLSLCTLSVLSATGAAYADVDNTVKYGEKYSCEIKTTEGNNYSLDIVWSAEPKSYSQFPEWSNVLKFELKNETTTVDSGYFSNIGFGHSGLDFNFAWDKYTFSSTESQSTRVGTNFSTIYIEMTKTYDDDGKQFLAVSKFKSTFEKSYYRLYEPKVTELQIESSVCFVFQASKV